MTTSFTFLRGCSISPRILVGANGASKESRSFIQAAVARYPSFSSLRATPQGLRIKDLARKDLKAARDGRSADAIQPVSLTRRFGSDASTNPPKYNGKADARTEFSKPYFYKTKMHAANAEVHRKKFIPEGSKVENVLATVLKSPGGLKSFAEDIGAIPERVVAYWKQGKIEQRLHGQVIALNQGEEQNTFMERYLPLASMESLFRRETSPDYGKSPTRTQNICFVMGPSGSGKTFFALSGLLSKIGMVDTTARHVTLYLQPPPEDVDFFPEGAVKDLCDWIKDKLWSCAEASSAEKRAGRLNMHACIVIDEASAVDLGGFFDRKENLSEIAKELKLVFDSVTLVLSGTDVTGRYFDSREDSFKFRLQPWDRSDFLAILQDKRMIPEISSQVTQIASAIDGVPVLNALTTNPRSASFVVDGLTAMTSGMPDPQSWHQRMSDWAPLLVANVVQKYKSRSGVGKLKDDQPRLVAAWVFGALKEAIFGQKRLPQFLGLNKDEKTAAKSLIYVNLEISREQLEWVDGKVDFPISVSPALAIVLSSMMGVDADVFLGWKSQERISALYLFREMIVGMYRAHVDTEFALFRQRWADQLNCKVDDIETKLRKPISTDKDVFERERGEYEHGRKELGRAFGAQLAEVRLFFLRTKVDRTWTDIPIPRINSRSIFMNGDMASFADAVGPYVMVNGKHCGIKFHGGKKDLVNVSLKEELGKCGLLLTSTEKQVLVLRGIFAIWSGLLDGLDAEKGSELIDTGSESKGKGKELISSMQRMEAFPENFLDTVVADEVEYLKIKFREDVGEWVIDVGEGIPLPAFEGGVLPETVTFFISTNARYMVLNGIGRITVESLHVDGTLDVAKLRNEEERNNWLEFLGTLRERVVVKFLFTSPRKSSN
jgi:hypothetical protein